MYFIKHLKPKCCQIKWREIDKLTKAPAPVKELSSVLALYTTDIIHKYRVMWWEVRGCRSYSGLTVSDSVVCSELSPAVTNEKVPVSRTQTVSQPWGRSWPAGGHSLLTLDRIILVWLSNYFFLNSLAVTSLGDIAILNNIPNHGYPLYSKISDQTKSIIREKPF